MSPHGITRRQSVKLLLQRKITCWQIYSSQNLFGHIYHIFFYWYVDTDAIRHQSISWTEITDISLCGSASRLTWFTCMLWLLNSHIKAWQTVLSNIYSIMMLMKFSDLSQSGRSNWVMWQVKEPCPRKNGFHKKCKNLDNIAVYLIASLKSKWKK